MDDEAYIGQLKAERDNIAPSFNYALRLLGEEIDRVEKRGRYTVIHQEKKVRTLEKVLIPVKQYPKHNFVGKLLGPQGSTLKNLQAETGTKISILGKGSMKDKKKEEELRKEGENKNHHLNEDLHLCVEVFSTPADGHTRIAHALQELEKFLVPDSEFAEEIRQQQMMELSFINGEQPPQPVGRGGRGGAPPLLSGRGGPPPPGGMGMRGRGAPGTRGRGGAAAPPHAVPAPSSRGGLAMRSRGGPSARGVPTRGAMLGVGRASARPVGAVRQVARPPPQQVYEEETYNTGYEDTAYDTYGTESYENSGSYGGSATDTQYYDYGHVATGRDTYEEYGADAGYGGQNGYKQSSYKPPTVTRPSSRGNSRAHPYASSGRGARY